MIAPGLNVHWVEYDTCPVECPLRKVFFQSEYRWSTFGLKRRLFPKAQIRNTVHQ